MILNKQVLRVQQFFVCFDKFQERTCQRFFQYPDAFYQRLYSGGDDKTHEQSQMGLQECRCLKLKLFGFCLYSSRTLLSCALSANQLLSSGTLTL